LVICAVLRIDLIRRRMSCVFAIYLMFDVRCSMFDFQETTRHLLRDFEVTDCDLKFVKRL